MQTLKVINATPAIAVKKTQNSKVGKIAVTHASQATCPSAANGSEKPCPHLNNGCYAQNGYPNFTTKRLNASPITDVVEIANIEAEQIDGLPGNLMLRLHIVGDCPTKESAEIVTAAAMRYKERGGQDVYGYSHAWRDTGRPAWSELSMLASTENIGETKRAISEGWAVAQGIEKFESDTLYTLYTDDNGQEVRLLPCPNQVGKQVRTSKTDATPVRITCDRCKLCAKDGLLRKQNIVIGFEGHGGQAAAFRQNVSAAATAAMSN
jgi:hypothetical protein